MEEPQKKGAQTGLRSGLYGWRKRCLYTILFVLLLVVTVNVTLVIWIIRVLQINHYGVAGLHTAGGEVQLTGQALVLDTLVSSKLSTPRGQTILLQSSDNITLTSDHTRHLPSTIYLGEGSLELRTPSFQVKDPKGNSLFSVDKDSVSLTTETLSISGQGGAVLDGSLLTPVLSAEVRSDLTLESANKSVHAVTATGVSVESRAGDIRAFSHLDLNLITVDGSIKFESANILIPNLRHTKNSRQPRRHHHHHPERIYQLCVCKDGELFLGEAETPCETTLCL